MRIYNDCLPCILKGALDAARLATDDEGVHRKILIKTMEKLSLARLHDPPPLITQYTQQQIKEITGNNDPYKKLKTKYNQFAKKILPELETLVNDSGDPFEMAVKIAIAGNIIDFGAMSDKGEQFFLKDIQKTIKSEIKGNTASTVVLQVSIFLFFVPMIILYLLFSFHTQPRIQAFR